MKYAQHHNMLVPAAQPDAPRPAPANPAPVTVAPEARGDAVSFSARLSPGILWANHYRGWTRRFDSPSPAEITITDEFERADGSGVEFRWHTPLPVVQADGKVIIQGTRGHAVITPPDGASIEIFPPRDLGCRKLATIVFRHPGASGTLVTEIRLGTGGK
jgi:catechol 2,3-dioxygenase-like lactoylglutathione lyase family enzyme